MPWVKGRCCWRFLGRGILPRGCIGLRLGRGLGRLYLSATPVLLAESAQSVPSVKGRCFDAALGKAGWARGVCRCVLSAGVRCSGMILGKDNPHRGCMILRLGRGLGWFFLSRLRYCLLRVQCIAPWVKGGCCWLSLGRGILPRGCIGLRLGRGLGRLYLSAVVVLLAEGAQMCALGAGWADDSAQGKRSAQRGRRQRPAGARGA